MLFEEVIALGFVTIISLVVAVKRTERADTKMVVAMQKRKRNYN